MFSECSTTCIITIAFVAAVILYLGMSYLKLEIKILVLARPWFQGPLYTKQYDLSDKVIIVTGGNAGIGKETVLSLAKMKATVIIASRNEKLGTAAVQEIQETTGNKRVEFMKLELANVQSVKTFAAEFKKKYSKLDILINNAGIGFMSGKTEDGFDLVFGTNHLGHFLLTHLLMDRLLQSVPARIINLTSKAYEFSKFNFEDVQSEKVQGTMTGYGNSKLANILFSQELAKRYGDKGISSFSVHPGTVYTGGLTKWIKNKYIKLVITSLLYPIARTFFKDVQHGAATTLKVALAPLDELKNGAYYNECKYEELKPVVKDFAGNAEKLWRKSEELLKL